MGFAPVTCPTTRNLESLFYPSAQTVAAAAFALVHDNKKSWAPEFEEAPEVVEFKGPF
jgi:pyruvate dehydrogenase E1 component beta subunit